ncbi:MAG: alcohol dehydrogenase catalytic domain-containing protein, partial [Acidimicrobiales bacterium]|nr:alcohol dehydrogenase catalytic domain-containing protein [Acidimicrobiales bacterium]
MAHEVRGVVAGARKAPVSVETVVVPDPGPGEALVRVQACGVCHTDLHYREGAINDEFPFLLGHEAAGTVEAVGPDVTSVEPGDYVVLAWR